MTIIYDNIAESVKVKSKCEWYEEGEKLAVFQNQNQIFSKSRENEGYARHCQKLRNR